ncbi:hypothetical protein IEN85_14425 [Pelagicoccus sp. NFK12]|uniref:Purine-cytosine permease n=1 Tax=Pelagicoccus enzymogenes TaxID=2773457 RepID=A0A927F8Z9_9BACT|nr:hypothetical protein [Pelagicoccus enzymogenes]MBD5780692.1 hypothetical protein [Pelagicoccus enzymogenes]MDQ8200144.1 hypothetical protein [Pelagicoccus enzymogenes]
MYTDNSSKSVDASRNDSAVNEYERQPVPKKAHKGAGKFWGMYAGEHAAGTEFMIGPLFLLNGVTLQNVFLGLLLGNLLAVLSWRYVCTPIATKARLTLYFQLEKIAGGGLVKVYNLANGVLFCFLAGAMVTVSATAVGIPFNMDMPAMEDVFPNSALFVVVALCTGGLIAVVATLGYDSVAKFANIASPWMVLVFVSCGIVAFKQLDVSSWDELNTLWTGSIAFAQEGKESSVMGFWSVVFFSWLCNAAMHMGMADLSVFRFAKKPSYGWATSAGMYVGHYVAWIAAAFMLAAQIKLTQNADPLAGPMAEQVTGLAGIICVIVAGWTTANPTIYRAGLAFQAMVPFVSRRAATLAAGALATLSGMFPALAFKLLDFVGLYGMILAPIGAIIFFNWYFRSRGDAVTLHERAFKGSFNFAVLFAWLIPIAISLYFIQVKGVSPWFFTMPCWIACGCLYLLFSVKSRRA